MVWRRWTRRLVLSVPRMRRFHAYATEQAVRAASLEGRLGELQGDLDKLRAEYQSLQAARFDLKNYALQADYQRTVRLLDDARAALREVTAAETEARQELRDFDKLRAEHQSLQAARFDLKNYALQADYQRVVRLLDDTRTALRAARAAEIGANQELATLRGAKEVLDDTSIGGAEVPFPRANQFTASVAVAAPPTQP